MPVNASVQVVIGALFTGGSAFGKATASITKIGDVVRRLSGQAKQLDQLRAAEQRAGLNVTSLTDRLAKQRAALLAAEGRVVSLKEKIAAAGDPTGKLAARLDSAEQAVLRAKAAIPQLDTQLVKARTDLTEASQAAEKFAAANAHVGASVARLEPMLKRYDALQGKIAANASRRNELLLQGAQIGAAIYGVKKLVEAAAEGEEAKLHLQWTLAPPDRAKIGDIVTKTRAFALGSLATMPELLEIQAVLNKEGLSAEVSLAASETAHKVAAVTQQEGGEVAKAIGAIYTQAAQSFTGRGPEEKLKQIGDLVSAMHHQFEITDVGGLGAGFASVLPQASAARVPIEQVAASIGFLTRAGIDAGGAGTMLRQTLIQLDKAADKLGFSVAHDAAGNMDLIGTFGNMNAAITKTYGSLDAGRDAINQAFGAKRAQAVMILSHHLEELSGAQKRLAAESAGSVEREYKELEESAKGTLTKIKKAFDEFLKPIGRALLPGIKAVLTPIGHLATMVGGFLERFPMLAKVIGTVAVGMLALAAASWAVSYSWNFMRGGMLKLEAGLLKMGIRSAAAKLGLLEMGAAGSTAGAGAEVAGAGAAVASGGFGAMAAAAAPFLIVGAAIAAAGFLIWRHWKPLAAWFKGFWNSFSEAMAPIGSEIRKTLEPLLPVWNTLKQFFGWLLGQQEATNEDFEEGASVGRLFGESLADSLRGAVTLIDGVKWALTPLIETLHEAKIAWDKLFPPDEQTQALNAAREKVNKSKGVVAELELAAKAKGGATPENKADLAQAQKELAQGRSELAKAELPATPQQKESKAQVDLERKALGFALSASTAGINPLGAIGKIRSLFSSSPEAPSPRVPDVPKLAAGGIVTRPTVAQIGEAGPEAVVPLGRLPRYALAAAMMAAPMATAPAAAPGGDTITVHVHAPITINAAPGMDEYAIARRVEAGIDRSVRNALSRRRAALHD